MNRLTPLNPPEFREASYLDRLYADRPDTRPAMRWPVWSFANPHKPTIAVFFSYSDAVDFVNENLGTRNLYIGEPTPVPPELQRTGTGIWQ